MRREVLEGLQPQGKDEVIVYTVTVSPAPTAVNGVTVTDEKTDLDVTATVMPTGSPSYAGSVITLPPLRSLTEGRTYRVELQYTSGVNTLEPFFRVLCER